MNQEGGLIYKSRFPFIGLFFLAIIMAFAVLVFYLKYSPILGSVVFILSGYTIAFFFTTIHIYTDRIVIDKPALPFYKAHVFLKDDIIYAGFVFAYKGSPKFEVKTEAGTTSFFHRFEINERDRIVDAIELIGIKSYRL